MKMCEHPTEFTILHSISKPLKNKYFLHSEMLRHLCVEFGLGLDHDQRSIIEPNTIFLKMLQGFFSKGYHIKRLV